MRMGDNSAALYTVVNSIQALGRGFDVNFDTRLLYCKGVTSSRIVEIDDDHTKDLLVCDDLVVSNVSRDIKCSQGTSGRERSWANNFYEMVEYFNKKAELAGRIPLGSFNSVFSFTGSKEMDAAATKSLAIDGYFIPLCTVELAKPPSALQANVKRAIPSSWDPSALASFIETFGTHVITSVTIGGKDVIYVKQHQSSPLSTIEIKKYVQEIGDQRFSDSEIHTVSGPMKSKDKASASFVFLPMAF
ncbi:hypothetical protein GIB67_041146 [Kingdonia uniflora]|uniref:MACPF domain-containing protein n=1 Tax=Kingdonia uniflora TaxID=39325 RepID=A0A7J7LKM4_9MAGN|nr:hypothetical protein GIB67_041146 [Kingdonia uniflora]